MGKTVKLSQIVKKTKDGREIRINFAKVADRLNEFREDCPNGLIETSPQLLDNGQVMFKTRILKDKSKPESAEATGHALGKSNSEKEFEKLETISVGRALALLGYAVSGEIASSEEMEDFYEYKNDQVDLAVASLKNADTIDSLKEVFMGLGSMLSEPKVIKAKDDRKAELSATS